MLDTTVMLGVVMFTVTVLFRMTVVLVGHAIGLTAFAIPDIDITFARM